MFALIVASLLVPETPPIALPRLRAQRLPSAGLVRVDGLLDEPVWSGAPVANGFRQREPLAGQPATEATEVRVLYDDENLYVGILAADREPERVIARILQRDQLMPALGFDQSNDFAGDDGVAILLDPFRDRRNASVFATNPLGAEFDALITDEGSAFNADWRGVWRVRARRVPEGWSAEFAIPFRTLRYPHSDGGLAWGFNVYRMIRRKNEQTLWASWTREAGGFHKVSQAGLLEGLEGLPRRGFNLELKPFGLVGLARDRSEDGRLPPSDPRADVGFDAKWEVSPGLVLDATVNPDFAQVEADDQRVNLTRFDLFFPEKRDFFLENAGIFDFGFRGFGEPPPFLLFFSRTIGIEEDEGEVPVLGGVRLSGRTGKQTLGFLDMVTGPAFGAGHRNYSVLRVKRDVGSRNYVGAIATDRRGDDVYNSAAGLDASFWPGPALNVQAFVARTWTSGPGGEGTAWRVGADYSGERFGVVAQHLEVGPEADAKMGFVTRTDIRRSDLFGRATWRPGVLGIRKVNAYAGGQYITGIHGGLQDWNVGPFAGIEWNTGESLGAFYSVGTTRIDEAFDLSDRLPVPVGAYDFKTGGIFASTSHNRPLVAEVFRSFERAYAGAVDSLGATLAVAAGPKLAIRLGYTRNSADLPSGSFDADLYSLRVSWAFSTRLTASAFLQYNSLDREWLTNLRLNFIHRPGSDLFVVFNEERDSDTPAVSRLHSRGLAVKATYLVRF